jgi:hypothetical protein
MTTSARAVLVLFLLAGLAPAGEPERHVLRLHYGPADREGPGRYQNVPVDVPEGTTRLSISYSYDRRGGENVVDLGLIEPGSLELGRARFRGWSGGERAAITVATGSATPGYWPGPLPPGRWHVQLGLYKVAPGGVDVELTVELGREPQGPPPPIPSPRLDAVRRGAAWYRGDLHTHTVHSDGKLTVAELARLAREAGLDFIAITDHNNTAHQVEPFPEDGPLHVVGEEVTTPGGHANVWGLGVRDFVDFRLLPGDPGVESIVRGVVGRGGLFSINHPFEVCSQCSWVHPIPEGVAAIEIWNGHQGPQEGAIALWDELLRAGRRITAVGSSDWHRHPQPIARGSVRVFAPELSIPAILAAVREGRVIVMGEAKSETPSFAAHAGGKTAAIGETLSVAGGAPLRVEVEAPGLSGGRADLYWNGEKAASSPLGAEARAAFDRTATADGYVRAQLYDAQGAVFALTNPIFVKVEAAR